MYKIIMSIKGEKTMTNEEIKAAFEAEYDPFYEDADGVQSEKDGGFLLYEDGCWNQYMEDMTC